MTVQASCCDRGREVQDVKGGWQGEEDAVGRRTDSGSEVEEGRR